MLVERPGFGHSEHYAPVRFAGDAAAGSLVRLRLTAANDERASGRSGMSEERRGWFTRLKSGLGRSSSRLTEGITGIFAKRRLDDAALAELEELLIGADLGVELAEEVTARLRSTRFNQSVAPEEIRAALAEEVAKSLALVDRPLKLDPALKPLVVLVVGVNGSGKTTTIGKLAKQYHDAGKKVLIAAGDTFRAAAVEQLKIWGERAARAGGGARCRRRCGGACLRRL